MNSVFNYNQNQVRTSLINNNPYFCLKDCCKILSIRNSKDVVNRLNQKGVAFTDLLTKGGKQKITFINEPNLYRLIGRSNKPEAIIFMDWVYEEVLPQIRKTGEYKPDFTTTLTTVKQHTRKLPTVRVKKEMTFPEDAYKRLGGVINRCIDARFDRIEKYIREPELKFNQVTPSNDTDLSAFDKKELFDDKKRDNLLKQAQMKLLSMIDEYCKFQNQIAEVTGAIKYNVYLSKKYKNGR